jgi:ribosomal protein S18 acetylase RimI-like enzyme
MMQAAEQWLLDRGVWKVNLFVRHGNEPVLAFYAALGYEPQAIALLGKWIDPTKKGG